MKGRHVSDGAGRINARVAGAVREARWPSGSIPRIIHAVAVVFAQSGLVFVVGFGFVMPRVIGDQSPFVPGLPALAVISAIIAAEGILIALGLLKLGRVTLTSLGWHSAGCVRTLAVGAAGGCVASVLAIIPGDGFVDAFTRLRATTPSEWGLFLFLGGSAGLIEESVFRGYLQSALAARLGMPAAILISAALFAGYHLNWHPGPLAVKFVFGIIFGVARVLGRSLWAPALAHSLVWLLLGGS